MFQVRLFPSAVYIATDKVSTSDQHLYMNNSRVEDKLINELLLLLYNTCRSIGLNYLVYFSS